MTNGRSLYTANERRTMWPDTMTTRSLCSMPGCCCWFQRVAPLLQHKPAAHAIAATSFFVMRADYTRAVCVCIMSSSSVSWGTLVSIWRHNFSLPHMAKESVARGDFELALLHRLWHRRRSDKKKLWLVSFPMMLARISLTCVCGISVVI